MTIVVICSITVDTVLFVGSIVGTTVLNVVEEWRKSSTKIKSNKVII